MAQFIDPYGSYVQGKKLAKNPKHLGAMANFHISILIKKICPRGETVNFQKYVYLWKMILRVCILKVIRSTSIEN